MQLQNDVEICSFVSDQWLNNGSFFLGHPVRSCVDTKVFRCALQLRPTPPHLTSAMAETILAQACENESNNAKRMRMGLEPLPAYSVSDCEFALMCALPAHLRETIVFLLHLLSATSKPFSSLYTRLAHAARLGFFYKNELHKFTVIIIIIQCIF